MRNQAILIAAALSTAACGPGFFAVEARYPTEPMTLEPDSGQTVFVKAVKDSRAFVAESTSLSVPVVWDDPPAKEQPQIIGARGDSVHAISNIYLPDGQDVESIVRHMLKAAFLQAGYDLADSEEDADLVAEADLGALWLWMTPSGMTIHVESIVQADVTVTGKGGTAEFQVDGYNDSPDAGTSPSSYQFALQEALYDFYDNLAARCISMEIAAPAAAP